MHRICLLTLAAPLAAIAFVSAAAGQTLPVTGEWNNNFFGSTGDIRGSLTITEPTFNASLEFGGFVFGQSPGTDGFHEPINLTGTINSDDSIDIDPVDDHPLFGDVTASVDAAGNVTGLLSDIPDPSIESVDVGGTLSDLMQFNLTYVVNFAPNSGPGEVVDGTATITAVPEPTTGAILLLGGLAIAGRRGRRRG